MAQIEVTICPSAYTAGEVAGAARNPSSRGVQVVPSGNGVALFGEVNTAAEAEQAVAIARTGRFTFSLLSNLSSLIGAPAILGVGYASTSFTADALIDVLAQDRLVTILAEPNLTAKSGEVASFLAGGEFSMPIVQHEGQISVAFRQYGVTLAFVPTVLAENRIVLRVRPELSDLTDIGAVQITGFQIPAFTVRRAETTMELGSGQSFAIAGLLFD